MNDCRICFSEALKTSVEKYFENIKLKKQLLCKNIERKHSKTSNHYKVIQNRKNIIFKDFIKIYHSRCAYCGLSVCIESINNFEIDHYICKSSNITDVNLLNNLIFSCKCCNRSKSNFLIPEEIRDLVNPDFSSYKQVFIRNRMFYIVISDKFKNNDFIKAFYLRMKFGNQFRRLDYLLTEIFFLSEYFEKNHKSIANKLSKSFVKLNTIRNRNTSIND